MYNIRNSTYGVLIRIVSLIPAAYLPALVLRSAQLSVPPACILQHRCESFAILREKRYLSPSLLCSSLFAVIFFSLFCRSCCVFSGAGLLYFGNVGRHAGSCSFIHFLVCIIVFCSGRSSWCGRLFLESNIFGSGIH